APEGVTPTPHRRVGDARTARGERRDAALVPAGDVELVDGAALVEEPAGAARVDGDDGARDGARAEVDPGEAGQRLDRGVGDHAVDAQDQPLDLATPGAGLAQPGLHAAVGDRL